MRFLLLLKNAISYWYLYYIPKCSAPWVESFPYLILSHRKTVGLIIAKNAFKYHFNLQDYKINDKPHLFSILLQGQDRRRRDSVLKFKKKKKKIWDHWTRWSWICRELLCQPKQNKQKRRLGPYVHIIFHVPFTNTCKIIYNFL